MSHKRRIGLPLPLGHFASDIPLAIVLQVAAPLRSAAVHIYGFEWHLHWMPLSTMAPLHVTMGDRVPAVDLVLACA